jgi:hypothetical protein
MIWKRKDEVAYRTPHPDPAVEAQLQHVLSRYEAISRATERMADIGTEQHELDYAIRDNSGESPGHRALTDQAARLVKERFELEAFISGAHRDIAHVLSALGDDALYLTGASG